MLDFSRVTFEKQIALVEKKADFPTSTRYPMEKLSNLNVMLRRGKSAKYGSSSIQIIKSGQARGHCEFDFSEKHFVADGFVIDERKLQPGDLLINSTGKGTAGRVTYFDLPGDFVADSHISILRPNDKLLPKFGLYSLARIGFSALEELANGASGQIELTLATIGEIQIPLPPLDLQRQIVADCEAIDAEAETARVAIAAAQADITRRIDAVYASPAPRVAIDALALAVQYGLSSPLNEAGAGYKVFRMNDIAEGRMVDNGAMKYADLAADEFSKYRLEKGDVLFNRTNGSLEHVGKTGLFDLDGEYCFASYLVRVAPDRNQVLPHYLAAMMNSSAFRQEAIGKAVRSAGQNNINATKMRQIRVPVLPLDAQAALVAGLVEQERAIAAARATLEAAPLKKADILRRAL